jgi:hypothetical protein
MCMHFTTFTTLILVQLWWETSWTHSFLNKLFCIKLNHAVSRVIGSFYDFYFMNECSWIKGFCEEFVIANELFDII